jgi:hypothetical protein
LANVNFFVEIRTAVLVNGNFGCISPAGLREGKGGSREENGEGKEGGKAGRERGRSSLRSCQTQN